MPQEQQNSDKPYYSLIAKYFGSEAQFAYKIAELESGVESKMSNYPNNDGSQDVGIFQVNDRWHCPKVGEDNFSNACHQKLLDPETNVRIAKQIRDESGWGAWATYNKANNL